MKIRDTEIIVKKGDITEEETQAIVNAANNYFHMRQGLASAIKKKGGEIIEAEAVKLGPVDVGESVITTAGNLKAEYVIHASVVTGAGKTDDDKIRKATASALRKARENNIASISFCALGCGVGGFPFKDSAKIMAQEVFKYLREAEKPVLKKIIFVLYGDEAYEAFKRNVSGYIEHLIEKTNQGPFFTVDGIVEFREGIVLIERLNPPFGWALPGGFVDYGESAEESVVREVKEETNLDFVDFKQFKVYSKPDRDPRFHTASAVFVGKGKGNLRAATDAKGAAAFKLDSIPEKIAFDHRQIIQDYIAYKSNPER